MKDTQPQILVVSNKPSELEIIKAELEISGYWNCVAAAKNAAAAFRAVAKRPCNLVVFDFSFQREESVELCRALRQEHGVPVLAIDNQPPPRTVKGVEFLPFPYPFAKFFKIVRKYAPLPVSEDDGDESQGLKDELRKYKDLFDRASDIILLIDYKTHCIIDANRQAELTYGYRRSELLGKSLLEIVPREQHLSILKNTKKIAKGTVLHHSGERIHIRKDGTPMHVTLSASLLPYGNRMVFQDIVRDETDRIAAEKHLLQLNNELYQTNYELEKRTAELEAANKELEAFAYSVSHDLRAPLRAINGFTRILMQDYVAELDEEANRLGSIVQENAVKMGRLIDDLLAFSRMGRADMNFVPIDMKSMAKAVFNEAVLVENRQNISFSIAELPECIGDPSMMRQVWMNLLSNALKFSGQREQSVVDVSFRVEKEQLVYCVRDNGVGFDAKYANKLFGVFQRLHSEHEFPGTGVGLSLVQRIIHRHGGRVWAESEPDKGAAFYFSLPIREQ